MINMLRRLIIEVVVNGFALWLAAEVVDGVHFDGNLTALAGTAIIFSIVTLLLKPFVILLTLPLTVFTFGFFLLVVNALMLMLTGALSQSYSVDGFGAAFVGGLLISVVGVAANVITGDIKIRSFRSSGRHVSDGRLGDT